MHRLLFLVFLLVSAGLGGPAVQAQTPADLPPRPSPFRFVTDEAKLLSAADAKTLENGLRRYADSTGTQVVVVTVPTLGGRDVADYGRALGEAWQLGQRDQNNGLIVLLSGQERQITIQAGSGLRSQITPELTKRVISQEMTPNFKQGRYFVGLRKGLSSLMQAANPASAPQRDKSLAAGSAAAAGAGTAASSGLSNESPAAAPPASEPYRPSEAAAPAPQSSGLGMGTLLIGALVVGGGIWLVTRLFRRKTPTPTAGGQNPYINPNSPGPTPNQTPDFLGNNRPAGGNQPTGPVGNYNRGPAPQQAPDFLGNRSASIGGGGGGLGSGMGGILATGAAAAAGAYLGNRMASGGNEHYTGNDLTNPGNPTPPTNLDPNTAAAAGGAASGGFPALDGVGNTNETAPDYFSDSAATDDAGTDYFSADETSSYDDTSSDDLGGGGFDDDNSNSGSW